MDTIRQASWDAIPIIRAAGAPDPIDAGRHVNTTESIGRAPAATCDRCKTPSGVLIESPTGSRLCPTCEGRGTAANAPAEERCPTCGHAFA
jgi:hypothetical protein